MSNDKLNALGFGANETETKPAYDISIADNGKVTIVLDAPMISQKEPNDKGNRVLNVYHKFNNRLKFSGNLILSGEKK